MVGDEISVSGVVYDDAGSTGKDRDYMLHFLNRETWKEIPHDTCMGSVQGGPGAILESIDEGDPGPDTIIGGPAHSDPTTGEIPPTTGIIPGPLDTTDAGGVARVCFIEVTPSPDSPTTQPYGGVATKADTLEIILL